MGVAARLFALVLIAMLPAVAIQTDGEFDLRRSQEANVRKSALQLAIFASGELGTIADNARALLMAFSKMPAVIRRDEEACSRYADSLKNALPRYAAIGAARRDGAVFCASVEYGGLNASDRPWFKRALESGSFTVGEYTIGRTVKRPVLQFAMPFVDEAGAPAGVVYALLDLAWLAAHFSETRLESGEALGIADRFGTILVRLPDNAQFTGSTFATEYSGLLAGTAPKTVDIVGIDGVPRIVGYVPPAVSSSGLYVGVGIAKAEAFASVDREQQRDFLMIGGGLALGLAAACLGGWHFFTRPIGRLSSSAARWAAGDYQARVALGPGRSDFARLGRAFDDMAGALRRREAERDRSEAALREAAARLEEEAVAREEASAKLRLLNDTLEERVAAETAARLEAEDAFRQAQKMEALGQLTGGVAHDFNNLLQVVVGNLEVLKLGAKAGNDVPAATVRAHADAALKGARRGASVTGHLLAFARQQPLSPKPVDVNRLVAGMSDLASRGIGEAIEAEIVLAAGLWRAFVDPNQLEIALLNLAINARDAMPDGGKLTVETANAPLDGAPAPSNGSVAAGQYVLISVSDTGIGMTDDIVAKAFEPFFTTKPTGKGTGLGLSQVYGFVKQSGGHAEICSDPGRGTTVKLYLPRAAGEDRLAVAPPATAAPEAYGNQLVLVVEDDADVRANVVDMLRRLGLRTLDAADGPTALELLDRRTDIDLLFADVGLSGRLNGRELADEAIRRRRSSRSYSRQATAATRSSTAAASTRPSSC
jgi:signal transduction histidine kinase